MADENWNGEERRSNGEINLLSSRIHSLHNDVSEIRTTLRDLTAAITKLALVEERLANTNAAQERAFAAIAKVEIRVAALEAKAPLNDQASQWIDRGLMALLGAFLMFVWDKIKGS